MKRTKEEQIILDVGKTPLVIARECIVMLRRIYRYLLNREPTKEELRRIFEVEIEKAPVD